MTDKEKPVIFLQGEKVYLRPVEETDLPSCTRWINDPRVRQFLTTVSPRSLADEQVWLESMRESDSEIVLTIVRREDDLPIGNIGLHRIDQVNQYATFGILIGEIHCHQKGYGKEAVQLMLKHAFHALNLRRVKSSVLVPNKASIKLHKGAGFVQEGLRREQYYRDGQWVDEIIYGLLRSDWEAHKTEPG